MKPIWRNAASIACVVILVGAAIAWHAYRQNAIENKLAEDVRACRVRAEQGDAQAEYGLGYMYYHGQGVSQDFAKAAEWFRKAADQGNAHAQCELGFMYSHGQGVPQNYAEALHWRHRAADQGDAVAEDGLAFMYYHGQGALQDNTEAVRWYRKAADQGYAGAESGLGFMYYYGYGVPQNRAEANRWFRKAADQGDIYALRTLGAKLTPLRVLSIFAKLFTGILLAFNFASFNLWETGKSLHDSRQKIITAVGALCLLSAGLSWYGYAHYLIRCLNCGLNSFTLVKWLLDGILVAIFIYFLMEERRRSRAVQAKNSL